MFLRAFLESAAQRALFATNFTRFRFQHQKLIFQILAYLGGGGTPIAPFHFYLRKKVLYITKVIPRPVLESWDPCGHFALLFDGFWKHNFFWWSAKVGVPNIELDPPPSE
jgi:hypothetical protein